MRKLISVLFFGLILLLFSSCFKRDSWFPDMDCITKSYEYQTTLSPSELPSGGGKVKLQVTAKKIVDYWQYGNKVNTEESPVDYTVALLNNPDGFELVKEGDSYFLITPINNRSTSIEVTLIVQVDGTKQNHTLKQEPKTYQVDVEIR